MTTLPVDDPALPGVAPPEVAPRRISRKPTGVDRVFEAGEQLLAQSQGGKCGVSTLTSTPASDLLTAKVTTTTAVAGTSTSPGALSLTATVDGGGQLKPQGAVTFLVDGVVKGNGVLSGGKSTLNLTGISTGAHTVVARFTPTGAAFNASESAPVTVNVLAATGVEPPAPAPKKARTKLVEKFKASYARGKSVKAKVLVKESAPGTPTGRVVIKRGKKVVGKGVIKKGVAVIKLKGLKKGKNKLVASYAGNKSFAASRLKFAITIK